MNIIGVIVVKSSDTVLQGQKVIIPLTSILYTILTGEDTGVVYLTTGQWVEGEITLGD